MLGDVSRFLPDLIVEGGRLELPGQGHRTATLVLEPEGLCLRAEGSTALVGWDAPWGLHPWVHASQGRLGLAFHAPPQPGSDLYLVLHATVGPVREAIQEIESDDHPGIRIPLRTHGITPVDDIQLFQRLRALLQADPEARARLGDPARIRGLRDDLARPLAPVPGPGLRALGAAWDIDRAIRAAGYAHPDGGRPSGGTVLDDRHSAIARVQAHLQHGGYTDEQVGRELDRIYYVDPWPFGALLLD